MIAKKKFKCQKVVYVLLYILLVQTVASTRGGEDENTSEILKENIDIDQNLELLPSGIVHQDFCDEEFIGNTMTVLSKNYLASFKDDKITSGLEAYQKTIKKMQENVESLQTKLIAFQQGKISAKQIISPTYAQYYKNKKEEKQNIIITQIKQHLVKKKGEQIKQELKSLNEIDNFKKYQQDLKDFYVIVDSQKYQAGDFFYSDQTSEKVNFLDKKFANRLHLDKLLFFLSSKTQNIVNQIVQIFKTNISQEKTQFTQIFPQFNWLDKEYVPAMRGLEFDTLNIDINQEFRIDQYRFWSFKIYAQSKFVTESVISSSLQNIKQHLQQFEEGDMLQFPGLTYLQELQIYACDLYAALLFEFQLVVKSDFETSIYNDLNANMVMYQFIVDNFKDAGQILNIDVCSVAIEPQEYFINQILEINILKKNRNTDEIQKFKKIEEFLMTDPFSIYQSSEYDFAKSLYDFDKYIVEKLSNQYFHQTLTVEDMRIIYAKFKVFRDKFNSNKVKINTMYEITIEFLKYLVSIKTNQIVNDRLKEEDIEKSMKMQYVVFTLMRLNATIGKEGYENIYENFETLKEKFKQMFKTSLNQEIREEVIAWVGQEEWENTLLITIEIITIIFERDQTQYITEVYEKIGTNFNRLKVHGFKPNKMRDETRKLVEQYSSISEKDFENERIIFRVYILDQIDQMIQYLQELPEKDKEQHNQFKKNLFKALVKTLIDFENKDSQAIKDTFTEKLQNSKNNDPFIKYIQIEFKKIKLDQFQYLQQNVYQNLFNYLQYQILKHVEHSKYSLNFLAFLQAYSGKQDQSIKFRRVSDDKTLLEYSLMQNLMLQNTNDKCAYEDKWNEDIMVDALFLYPNILVKHREKLFQNQNECIAYDPLVMTKEEYKILSQYEDITPNDPEYESIHSFNEQDAIKFCVVQRNEHFKRYIGLQETTINDSFIPYEFVYSLIESPEIFGYVENLEFMADSFQLFRNFQYKEGQVYIEDNSTLLIFIDIYKFLIQIRSDSNFVYSGNFWDVIIKYMHECMFYQRYSHETNKKPYCSFGYARLNEMYWFVQHSQFAEKNDIQVFEKALKDDEHYKLQNKNEHQQNHINWGSITNARFNPFIHYLLKTKQIEKVDGNDTFGNNIQKENNQKLALWSYCEEQSQVEGKINFCKFINKVSRINDYLLSNKLNDLQLNGLEEILLEDIDQQQDIQKLIIWQVLDFFAFEQDIKENSVIEKIRKLFDSKYSKVVKKDLNAQKQKQSVDLTNEYEKSSMEIMFKITDAKLLGQYAKSKYDENTTISNYGHEQQKKNQKPQVQNLDSLLKQKLNNKDMLKEFLSLEQRDEHSQTLAQRFKIYHHIPLSLALYYADSDTEFENIAQCLIENQNIQLLFFSDVDAGELVQNNFQVYYQNIRKNLSKDVSIDLEKNLIEYIANTESNILEQSNNIKIQQNRERLMKNLQSKYIYKKSQVRIPISTINQTKLQKQVSQNEHPILQDNTPKTTQLLTGSINRQQLGDRQSIEVQKEKIFEILKIQPQNSQPLQNTNISQFQSQSSIKEQINQFNSMQNANNRELKSFVTSQNNMRNQTEQDKIRISIQNVSNQVITYRMVRKQTTIKGFSSFEKQNSKKQSLQNFNVLI